ncbi:MAG: hypothetical protein K2M93_08905 [Muribaculaceae bacterium]|nr:hypothetical protein [Muribaculaceae bacterium]
MKRLKLSMLTALAIILTSAPFIKADEKSPATDSGGKTMIIIHNPIGGNGRPKAPSKQHIECWYCDGELSFDFVIPEGECTLYLTDYATGFMTQYVFDSADHADIYVGALPNGGSIEINTASGHIYYGQIVIDD